MLEHIDIVMALCMLCLVALAIMVLLCRRQLRWLQGHLEEVRRNYEVEHDALRRKLYARQHLEQEIAQLRRFVYAVGHEMRSSVTAIHGFAQMLTQEDTLSSDDRLTSQQQLASSSDELLTIVDKFTEFGFYVSQKSLPCYEQVVVNELCQDLVDSFRRKVKAGVKIDAVSFLPNDSYVLSNSHALQRMLIHLLNNAVRHTEQGEIVLGANLNDSREWLTLSVADTGSGIEVSRHKTLFDLCPDSSIHRGLPPMGLPLCRHISHLLGGSISIDGGYRDGTRIEVRIPFRN